MDNDSAKLIHCFSGDTRHRHVVAAVTSEPYDEGLGYSFCYIRLDALATASIASSKVHHSEETPTFRTITGASVGTNTTTSLSITLADLACLPAAAATFESSTSFSSIPLQPVPCFSSRPLSSPLALADRGFLSGPIERGFMSGPLDHRALSSHLPRSRSHDLALRRRSCRTTASLLRGLTKGIARTISPPLPATSSAAPSPGRCPATLPHARSPSSARPRPRPSPCDIPLVAAPPPHDLLCRPFPCPPPLPHPARNLLPLPSPLATPPSPRDFLRRPFSYPPPLLATSSATPSPTRPPPRDLPLVTATSLPFPRYG